MFRNYYRLAKPGIVYGNTFTTLAGFLFALQLDFSPLTTILLLATLVGLGLVIASAAVFNNYLDRDIDKKMERTNKRPLVTGVISPRAALIYGTVLGLIGFAILYFFVNILSTEIALFGFIFYALIYTIAKHKTSWAAVIGSIPGAVPILVGYTAVTNHLDGAALILFLVMVAWQMPHFYAIAIYRLKEYEAANIPVLPAKKGIARTKIHMLLYIIAFLVAAIALFAFGYVGYVYLVLVLTFGLSWLWRSIKGFKTADDPKWARSLFLYSLVVLVAFCVAIILGPVLP
jgi:protoheme IX farnesyltransferase